ncbi:MAG: 23S rRNA (guanosine2251-2'-O)-methyltransferase [Candidatus Aldehydirespiratoraceae bacterium]|jgi:23S rRNA (guanosine2251-2'-O)-methyltransferase
MSRGGQAGGARGKGGPRKAAGKGSAGKGSGGRGSTGSGSTGRGSTGSGSGGKGAAGKGPRSAKSEGRGKGQPRNPRPRSGQGGRSREGQRGTTPLRELDGASRGESLGGDQVEGRHAVRELLIAGTRRTREVVLAGDLDSADILDEIIDLADELKVTITEISRSKFESMTRTEASQGVLALAQPLQPVALGTLLEPDFDGTPPFLIMLDGITDPGNLGAILRTAECAGVTGVILPRHRAAHITPTVAKAAAGAVEHLQMALVPGLPTAMGTLKSAGVWTVGLDAGGDQSIHDLAVAEEPVALVLGAEGPGLSRLVRERCDTVASIPLLGVLDSLNVSAAAAVACFEVARRRAQKAS